MIKAIVIEDDPGGLEHILRLIKNNLHEVEVIGTGRSNADLIQLIEEGEEQPHVLVLDIRLPDGQVFQSLDVINTSEMEIIFTTAYNEYAIQAFDKAAIHYLLKPISKDDLILAFQRVKRNIARSDSADQPNVDIQMLIAKQLMQLGYNTKDRVGISGLQGVQYVEYRDIIRVEGDDNYTTFFLTNQERIVASRNLGHFVEMFNKHHFVKVHQSHMININHLTRYVRGEGGYVVMSNGEQVPVARRNRGTFLDTLKKFSDYS